MRNDYFFRRGRCTVCESCDFFSRPLALAECNPTGSTEVQTSHLQPFCANVSWLICKQGWLLGCHSSTRQGEGSDTDRSRARLGKAGQGWARLGRAGQGKAHQSSELAVEIAVEEARANGMRRPAWVTTVHKSPPLSYHLCHLIFFADQHGCLPFATHLLVVSIIPIISNMFLYQNQCTFKRACWAWLALQSYWPCIHDSSSVSSHVQGEGWRGFKRCTKDLCRIIGK